MIKINKNLFKKSTEAAAQTIRLKLEDMVGRFCEDIAEIASKNTPRGNPEEADPEGSYYELYEIRADEWKISIAGGYHKGAWEYSEDGTPTFNPEIRNGSDVVGEMQARYELGKGAYIAAIGPGYAALEGGSSKQAPEGIMQPSEEDILAVYATNITSYYRKD